MNTDRVAPRIGDLELGRRGAPGGAPGLTVFGMRAGAAGADAFTGGDPVERQE
jgi:hypothetical protein